MRRATAELIVKDPNKFAHHDRVFLNNPVVMQGMGSTPLVVRRSGQNAVMLAVAVALLLCPPRAGMSAGDRLCAPAARPAPKRCRKSCCPCTAYGFSTAGCIWRCIPS